MLTIGSLFSGIGGLEKGLEDAGLGPVLWQCEIDPFCRQVLARHWPDAKRYEDVRTIDETAPRVDLLCGGFPCQDISNAGARAGIDGERSGLWAEFARCIRVLRPHVVVIENVSGLLGRGMGRVLGDLAALGYDAEWSTVRAEYVGAPHRRERVFIVAHARCVRRKRWGEPGLVAGPASAREGEGPEWQRHGNAVGHRGTALAHGHGHGREGERRSGLLDRERATCGGNADGCDDARLGDPTDEGCAGAVERRQRAGLGAARAASAATMADAASARRIGSENAGGDCGAEDERSRLLEPERARDGSLESRLGLPVNGIPGRMARWPAGPEEAQHAWEAPRVSAERIVNRPAKLRALGNAVVPAVGEAVGLVIRQMIEGPGQK